MTHVPTIAARYSDDGLTVNGIREQDAETQYAAGYPGADLMLALMSEHTWGGPHDLTDRNNNEWRKVSEADDYDDDCHAITISRYAMASELLAAAERLLGGQWDGESLVYHDDGTHRDYRCESESELVELGLLIMSDREDIARDAYSHWCSMYSHDEVEAA